MKYLLLPLICLISFQATAQDQSIEEILSELSFRNVGPSRGGRVTTVAGIESQPSTYYMGATGGGVWKTTNYGNSWQNVSDGFFATGSIGAIRVAQNNPDIVYVGTGSDGIRSNVIIGKGMYRSDDAGKTWSFLGLKNAGQIGAVEIHPTKPEVCYVAAIGNPFGSNPERGVFKTTNGGQNWEKVLFISESTGVADLEICPDNPDIIYASAWAVDRKPWTIKSGSEDSGVFKSIDGGNQWTSINNGLTSKTVFALAVDPENSNTLFAGTSDPFEGGLFKSSDGGENWSSISTGLTNLNIRVLALDPFSSDRIYLGTFGGGSYVYGKINLAMPCIPLLLLGE